MKLRFPIANSTPALFLTAFVPALATQASHAAPGDVYTPGTVNTPNEGWAVNASGQVAAASFAPASAVRAYRYDVVAGGLIVHDLGTLGGTRSLGRDINASGQIAGGAYLSNDTAQHAFRYDGYPGAGGTMRDLGTLGGSDSFAFALNNTGQVAGGSLPTSGTSYHAFLYTGTPGAGGTMVDLGTLGGSESFARAINDAGQVIGYALTTNNAATRAFLYSGTPEAGGAMHDLGTISGTGNSAAYDINATGQVVGTADARLGYTHAFRFDGVPVAGGTMLELAIPVADTSSASGINASGFVVGSTNPFSDPPADDIRATLWFPDRSALNLDTWLDTVDPAAGSRWTLRYATDISDNGWITGGGYFDGSPQTFLLDAATLVPDPSALLAPSAALPPLLLSRRRRRPRSI